MAGGATELLDAIEKVTAASNATDAAEFTANFLSRYGVDVVDYGFGEVLYDPDRLNNLRVERINHSARSSSFDAFFSADDYNRYALFEDDPVQ
ncbi:MAG: hypothetical protein AAF468_16280 [Pseudomonadota bacterium]